MGHDPITVTAQFRDVLDLVPDSTVKVDDVTVGKITDVSLEGYTAEVTMQLRNDTRLPDNAVATIQQTSLLGEKFVQLAAPASGASANPLRSGDVIPIAHTGQNPEVEQVLGALSLLLNGGGVGQLQTITARAGPDAPRSRGCGALGPPPGPLVRRAAGPAQARHRPGPAGARPAVEVARGPALDHRRHPGRAARSTAVDQQPAARPGPDAAGALAPERCRRPRDPTVEGVDDRHPAPAEPGAEPAPGVRRRLRQGRQRRAHLPVRGRRRRS